MPSLRLLRAAWIQTLPTMWDRRCSTGLPRLVPTTWSRYGGQEARPEPIKTAPTLPLLAFHTLRGMPAV